MRSGLDILSSIAQAQKFQQHNVETKAEVLEHQISVVLSPGTIQAQSLYNLSSANAIIDSSADISDKSNGEICFEAEAKNVDKSPPFESRDFVLKKASDRNLTPTKSATNRNRIKLDNNNNSNENESRAKPASHKLHTLIPPLFYWANSSESPKMPVQPSIANDSVLNSIAQPHFAVFSRNYASSNDNNASQNYLTQQIFNNGSTDAFTFPHASGLDQQKLQPFPHPLSLSHLSPQQVQQQHQHLLQLQARHNNDQLMHPHRNNYHNDMSLQSDPLFYLNSPSFELFKTCQRFDISPSQKHAHFLQLQRQQLQLQHQQLMLLSSQINSNRGSSNHGSNNTILHTDISMNMNADSIDGTNNFRHNFNNNQFSPQTPNTFEDNQFIIIHSAPPALLSFASIPASQPQIQQTQSIPMPLQPASQFLTTSPIIQLHSGSFLLSPQPQPHDVPTTQLHLPVTVGQHQQLQKQLQMELDTSSHSSEFLCTSEYDDDNADSDDEQVIELMRAENADLLARYGNDDDDEMLIDGGGLGEPCEENVDIENLDNYDESSSDGDKDDYDSSDSSNSDTSSCRGSIASPNSLNPELQCNDHTYPVENRGLGDRNDEENDEEDYDKRSDEFEILNDATQCSPSIVNPSPMKKRKVSHKKRGKASKLSQTLSLLLDVNNTWQYNEQEAFDKNGEILYVAKNSNAIANPRKLKSVSSNTHHISCNNFLGGEQRSVVKNDYQYPMSIANQLMVDSDETLYSTVLSTSNKRRPGRIVNMRSESLRRSSTSTTRGDTAPPSSLEPLEKNTATELKKKRGRKPGSVVVGGKVVDVATRRQGIYGTPAATSSMSSSSTPAPYLLSSLSPQTEKNFFKDIAVAIAGQNESHPTLTCPKFTYIESPILTLPSRLSINVNATAVYHATNTDVFQKSVPRVAVAADETITTLFAHAPATPQSARSRWGFERDESSVVTVASATAAVKVLAAQVEVAKRGTGRSVGCPRGSGRGGRGGRAAFVFGVGRGRGRGRGGGGPGHQWFKKTNVDSDSSSSSSESDSESNKHDGNDHNDDDGLEQDFEYRKTFAVREADRIGDTSVVAAGFSVVAKGVNDAKKKNLNEKIITEELKRIHEKEQQSPASPKLSQIKKRRNSTASFEKDASSSHENITSSSTKVSLNTYSKVDVWEANIGGIGVMRRAGDGWFNATHLLKIAGFIEKAKRTKMLERLVSAEVFPGAAVSSGGAGAEATVAGGEKTYEKIQGGYGRYQGTWVPADRALELAEEYGILERVQPLFDCSTSSDKPNTATTQNLESCRI
ncbi:transcriptional regulator swi6 [Physocladia obscura]|uniref:Transcriptional regulator swi6 n=1 Tax=Physocladia obscura TaxID=109957 RepID=A0AAD5T0N9_9FUNG|nr:transcriptional regulator swi6 [Physocladia obscura]